MTVDRDALLEADARARRDALDCTRSFLVQAPAGSGKTELLIQRLLALLARVENPERIVAVTFTRKAAGEMRERVVKALVDADCPAADDDKLDPHDRETRRLARAALAQDATRGWRLVEHPSRLAIHTLDALAQSIASRAPLASGLSPSPRIVEDARPLYLDAARSAIAAAPPDDPRWRALLWHRDNDADDLARSIAELLKARDQWQPLLDATGGDARAALEHVLRDEVEGELAILAGTVDLSVFAPLAGVAAAVARNLDGDDEHAGLREALADVAARGAPPPLAAAHLEAWRAIAAWLFTRGPDAGLRKSAGRMAGVPAIGKGAGTDGRRAFVQAMDAWLADLADAPGVEDALATLLALPSPRYDDGAWSTIEALLGKLRECATHLEAVFAAEGAIDFPRVLLAALVALGPRDAPSDLLLRLDYAIEHLLIDEFQDTSWAQLELIGRLVAGWTPGDGRTLFAVGDPMQSIYRFRGAEVRAFVEAQAAGTIEGVPVEALTLARNFRSQAGLVDWVNARFPRVLGAASDPWQGRVAFAAAVAHHDALDGPACIFEAANDDADEARRVVAHVSEALAADERGTVAILVRARTHLGAILPALRAAGIAYSAVDLDTLADRPAVRDALSLLHAILQPDDRLAWLALLRSPMAGLPLGDLDAIVRAADALPGRAMEGGIAGAALSGEGRHRADRVATVVATARAAAPHAPLPDRLRGAWLALGGPATLDDAIDLDAVEDVISLAGEHARGGDLDDRSAFLAALAERKLAPPAGASARVSVMTMHKAKGLQFDTVVLPGLARGRTQSGTPLLRWRTRRHGILVGVRQPRGGDTDPVHAYLLGLVKREEAAELARTAYVAWTRARRRAVLLAAPKAKDGAWVVPGEASLLGRVDPSLLDDVPPPGDVAAAASAAPTGGPLERVPAGWAPPPARAPLPSPALAPAIDEVPPFDWARERARRFGVVVHRLYARVDELGLDAFTPAALATRRDWVEAALVAEGALPAEAVAEAGTVRATVAATLADARGRWIFDPAHADRRVEWALAGVDDGAIVHVTLDRAFVANGERWIVDFKTGTHEGGDAARFLEGEAERYAPQLRRYARIVEALDPACPVRIALYHPRVAGGWRELAR